MTRIIKKFLIGASIAVGVSAIATTPAQAVNFNFNSDNYRTYSGGSNGSFSNGVKADAIKALTDANASSNVELWYTDESPNANVGFTATGGNYSVSVTSVTKNDWANFAGEWVNGFLGTYGGIIDQAIASYVPNTSIFQYKPILQQAIATYGLPFSGDPNVGSFLLNESTGAVDLKLVGHFDLKPRLVNLLQQHSLQYGLGNLPLINAINKITAPIQVSEVAKVTRNSQTSYAYSFFASESGITASDDGISYSGIFNWSLPGVPTSVPVSRPATAVPEPSALLGLLGVAGMFAAQRKLKKA